MSTRLASAGPDHRFARPSERSPSASPNAWSSSAVSVCDSAAVALATTREPEPAADPGRVLLLVPLRSLDRADQALRLQRSRPCELSGATVFADASISRNTKRQGSL